MTTHHEYSDKIFKIIHEDLKGLNLTSIDNSKEFYLKQYWDSIFPFLNLPEMDSLIGEFQNIVDVGFGGGFPLLPLALNFPQKNIYGIESKNKKVQAVKLICQKMNISNVKVAHLRLEELSFNRDCLVTFKAVGKIFDYLKIINSEKNIAVVFFKGRNLRELEDVPDSVNGLKLVHEADYQISPEILRKLVVYKRSVPRGTNSRNNLVNLSIFD